MLHIIETFSSSYLLRAYYNSEKLNLIIEVNSPVKFNEPLSLYKRQLFRYKT